MNGTVIVECIIDKTGVVRDGARDHQLIGRCSIRARSMLSNSGSSPPGTLYGNKIDTIFNLTVSFRVTM